MRRVGKQHGRTHLDKRSWMEGRKRLATFVHVSDIHIGRVEADGDAEFLEAWRLHPQLDGFLGHEYAALALLDRFVAELRRQEDIHLIVTGDLRSEFLEAWRLHPQLDGFLGHEYAALALLDRFVAELRRQEDIHLIVTGDL